MLTGVGEYDVTHFKNHFKTCFKTRPTIHHPRPMKRVQPLLFCMMSFKSLCHSIFRQSQTRVTKSPEPSAIYRQTNRRLPVIHTISRPSLSQSYARSIIPLSGVCSLGWRGGFWGRVCTSNGRNRAGARADRGQYASHAVFGAKRVQNHFCVKSGGCRR